MKSVSDLAFTLAEQDKMLGVRVTFPDAHGPFPTVLFSHGALSSKDLYNGVADHWASHGFATILPTHLDSESLGYSIKSPLPRAKIFFGRIGDMQFLLNHIDDIAAAAGIPGQLDKARLAVGGHSFGGWTALIMAGLPVTMPDGSLKSFRDPRLKALVSYNGIGPLPEIDADGWRNVTIPVLAAGGTNDPGSTGDGVRRPWRWRMGAYDHAASAEKYAVSITSGDHYYGGLICREGAGGAPDPEGLAIVNGVSTAFLDATLQADTAAKEFLKHADLPALTAGRGFLERS
ncbi:MAG: hypothetical protein KDE14_04190 [Rhodobacteraceae bacterium]|nr:hypothetical protein [Paracoccaceae bacterium]